jgi:hypothetical protein
MRAAEQMQAIDSLGGIGQADLVEGVTGFVLDDQPAKVFAESMRVQHQGGGYIVESVPVKLGVGRDVDKGCVCGSTGEWAG